jgi:hypothetical protein
VARRWWENPWVWGTLGAAVVGASMVPEVRFMAKDIVGRGAKASTGRWYKGDERYGFIETEPEDLRRQAELTAGINIPLDVYSLARMIRSEGASAGRVRAHVALNDLKTFRYAATLHGLLTYSTDNTRRGWYGKQYSGPMPPEFPKANKRRYATSKDPYEADLHLALKVIDERRRGIDPTRGASKFLDISSMGKQEGSRTFASVDAEWKADGYVSYTLPEYGSDLVLYRRA